MTNISDMFSIANTLATKLKLAKLQKKEIDAARNMLKYLMQEAGQSELDTPEGTFKKELVRASLSQMRLIQAGTRYHIDKQLMTGIIAASFALKPPVETLVFSEK